MARQVAHGTRHQIRQVHPADEIGDLRGLDQTIADRGKVARSGTIDTKP